MSESFLSLPTDYTTQILQNIVRNASITMAVNGKRVPGLLKFTTRKNNYWAADTFHATIALDGTSAGFGPPFWSLNSPIELELFASLDSTQPPTSMMIGLIDVIEWNLTEQVIEVTGRDYSSTLIDTRTTEKFPNLTSSAIASLLAKRRNLLASVQATTTPAGHYYHVDHIEATDRTTEWQLLTFLAEQEGFNLWVEGRTLFFEPASINPPPLKLTYAYATATSTVQANAPQWTMTRQITLAHDITVTVISWNHEHKTPIKAVATGTRTRKATKNLPGQEPASNVAPQSFVIRVPGLTLQKALALAQKKLDELSKHERKGTVSNLPMILGLSPRGTVQVVGTQTDFDQSYFIDEISRTFSARECDMTIEFKNASPQAQLAL